jgi:hypothetical protein
MKKKEKHKLFGNQSTARVAIFAILSLFVLSAIGSASLTTAVAYSCTTDPCAYAPSKADTTPITVMFMAPVSELDKTNGKCMVSGADTSTCPVYEVVGNELMTHNVTTGLDKASYNGAIHKTYEYTFIREDLKTNVSLGTFLNWIPNSSDTNNVYWNVETPLDNTLCGNSSPSGQTDQVNGTCIDSGVELSTNGGYLGNATDGRQYIAQYTDGFQSITGSTNLFSSNGNLVAAGSNPGSSTYPINSNENRHSMYWQAVSVTSSNTPSNGACANTFTSLPLVRFAGISIFYSTITSPYKFQIIYWVAETNGKVQTPESDSGVSGPCGHYVDTGARITSGKQGTEWAIYSTPSSTYQAILNSLGPHFSTSGGGTNGEYCCDSVAGGTGGTFENGSGDNYAFYTVGFHLSNSSSTSALSLDNIIDSSAHSTTTTLP